MAPDLKGAGSRSTEGQLRLRIADGSRITRSATRPATPARWTSSSAARRSMAGRSSTQAELSIAEGVVGDTWNERSSSRTDDGGSHPDMQLNVINARCPAWSPMARRRSRPGGRPAARRPRPQSRQPAGGHPTGHRRGRHRDHRAAAHRLRQVRGAFRQGSAPLRQHRRGRQLRLRGLNARVVSPARSPRRHDHQALVAVLYSWSHVTDRSRRSKWRWSTTSMPTSPRPSGWYVTQPPGCPAGADPRAVRRAVLLQGHAPRALRPSPPGGGASDRRALPWCRRRARHRPPVEHLRAGQPRHLQQRRRRRRRHGAVLGTYRKSHIPDGPGYTEKYYFNPGDTGFQVWRTQHATVGVGICWDQWFPESARCMALLGAEVLCYPTAIGSEPPDPQWDSSGHWQRVMQGHAGANLTPLIAANRIGHERGRDDGDHVLRLVVHRRCHRRQDRRGRPRRRGRGDGHVQADAAQRMRHSWGVFRDRRPDLYGPLLTLDGTTAP